MIKSVWDPDAKAYAANILVKCIQALQAEVDGVHLNKDIEHVHRMRVASRRLRNALQIFSFFFPEKHLDRWLKSIKKITSSLGEARDRDVQILLVQKLLAEAQDHQISPGLKRVILRLKQKRSALQDGVILALDDLTSTNKLIEIQSHLASYPVMDPDLQPVSNTLYHLAWETILPMLQEFLSYEIFIEDPANAAELHAMRISAKNMRYSMELFSPFYPDKLQPYLQAVRQTQEKLGNVHDSSVWNQYLSSFLEKERQRAVCFYGSARGINPLQPGLNYLSEYHKKAYQEQHQAFLISWGQWQNEDLWQELVNTLKVPLI